MENCQNYYITFIWWSIQWRNETKRHPRATKCRPLELSQTPIAFFALQVFFAAPSQIFATSTELFAAPCNNFVRRKIGLSFDNFLAKSSKCRPLGSGVVGLLLLRPWVDQR